MANNYQAYLQSRNQNMQGPQSYNGQDMQQQYVSNQMNNQQMPYDNLQTQQTVFSSLGFKEVDGMVGVNRYPVAPGSSVQLKDAHSMTLFIKSADLSGAILPLRVFGLTDITQEYQDRETPVSRAEFNQMNSTMNDLASAISGMKQLLEDLTAPASN